MTFFVHVILISCRSYSSKHSYLRSFLVHVNLSSYHSLFMLFLDHDILSSNNHDNMLFSVLAVLSSNHSMFHFRKIISFYILRIFDFVAKYLAKMFFRRQDKMYSYNTSALLFPDKPVNFNLE